MASGVVYTIKSPVTKRAPSAPVAMSGWLYKQGSDGLKVWRKRWFVLSEYCLFYYKGPEEEKLLGSILLPSYSVSAAGVGAGDERINRKYAFKCEHQNMRTYWLAAEQPDAMGQWIRALTAATLMQGGGSGSGSGASAAESSASTLSPQQGTSGGENSDSGIHTYQSQVSKHAQAAQLSIAAGGGIVGGPLTPASDGGGGGGGVGGGSGGPQPLYANAPPKPRRANDGGYSSPSPENSIELQAYDASFDTAYGASQYRQSTVKSPLPITASATPTVTGNNAMQRMFQLQQQQQLRQQTAEQMYGERRRESRSAVASAAFPGVEPSTHDLQQLQNIYATDMQQASDVNTNPFRTNDTQSYDDQNAYQAQFFGDLTPSDDLAMLYTQHQQKQGQGTTTTTTADNIWPSQSHHIDVQQQSHDQYQLQQHQQQLQRMMGASGGPTHSTSFAERPKADLSGSRYMRTDYEDIYNAQQQQRAAAEASYRRPMSPPMPMHMKYTPNMALDAELAAHMNVCAFKDRSS